jgi:hypothetical protein
VDQGERRPGGVGGARHGTARWGHALQNWIHIVLETCSHPNHLSHCYRRYDGVTCPQCQEWRLRWSLFRQPGVNKCVDGSVDSIRPKLSGLCELHHAHRCERFRHRAGWDRAPHRNGCLQAPRWPKGAQHHRVSTLTGIDRRAASRALPSRRSATVWPSIYLSKAYFHGCWRYLVPLSPHAKGCDYSRGPPPRPPVGHPR